MELLDVINEDIAATLRNKFIEADSSVIRAWAECLIDRKYKLKHIKAALKAVLPMKLQRFEVLATIEELCIEYSNAEAERNAKQARRARSETPKRIQKPLIEKSPAAQEELERRAIVEMTTFAEQFDVDVRDCMTEAQIEIATRFGMLNHYQPPESIEEEETFHNAVSCVSCNDDSIGIAYVVDKSDILAIARNEKVRRPRSMTVWCNCQKGLEKAEKAKGNFERNRLVLSRTPDGEIEHEQMLGEKWWHVLFVFGRDSDGYRHDFESIVRNLPDGEREHYARKFGVEL